MAMKREWFECGLILQLYLFFCGKPRIRFVYFLMSNYGTSVLRTSPVVFPWIDERNETEQ